MKLRYLAVACLAAGISGTARAQTFPFEEDFTSFQPGSTGGPAWSALRGLQWNVEDGALKGPVFARFNLRPPSLFTAEASVMLPAGGGSAGFVFDGQDEAAMSSSDEFTLAPGPAGAGKLTVRTGAWVHPAVDCPLASAGPVRLRLTVDAGTGRYACFVGDDCVAKGAAEYPSGLFAVTLGEGASLKHISLRAPTAAEKKQLLITTLFNDPRDIADSGDGLILVLHRGSPAVLGITADGEVKKTYGRRLAGSLTDPVALSVGSDSQVYVLNRFPGEVIAYDQNGGIRRRFGKGRLSHPSDIAALPDGTVYVTTADTGGGAVAAFDATGTYLGKTPALAAPGPALGRLFADGAGNVVVTQEGAETSTVMRPGPDRLLATVHTDAEATDDIATDGTSARSVRSGTVTAWPTDKSGTAFHASAVGGLETDLRIASVGGVFYVLDRRQSRIVAVPADLKDVTPDVTFQNISGSSALVRWSSGQPEKVSRVRLLRGATWDPIRQVNATPTTSHQVPIERLVAGRTYRYCLSPTNATIPPRDWSVEYTFQTPGTEAKP